MTVTRGRLLLVFLTVATLAAAAAAEAQGRVWRIGVLEPLHPAVATHLVDAFQHGSRDLGYEEGRNVQAAPSIPIIMSAVGDPVAEGFVESLARPDPVIE